MVEIKVHPFDINSEDIEALKGVFYDVKKKQVMTKQGESLQFNLEQFMEEYQIKQKKKDEKQQIVEPRLPV